MAVEVYCDCVRHSAMVATLGGAEIEGPVRKKVAEVLIVVNSVDSTEISVVRGAYPSAVQGKAPGARPVSHDVEHSPGQPDPRIVRFRVVRPSDSLI